MSKKKLITKDDMKRAVLIFNCSHRRFNIVYDDYSNFFTIRDKKQGEYKVFITIPNLNDIDDFIKILEDLIIDLK